MTGPADRRTILRRAAWAALVPLLSQMPQPAAATNGTRFAPPARPMRYTRTLTRHLAGDAILTVERSFAVTFTPTAGGFAIDGRQIHVAVDAPAALADLARLERERIETGLFPLQLDADGRIAGGPDIAPGPQLDRAVELARAQIARASGDRPGETETARFVLALQQSAAALVTELPTDLFAPAAYPRFDRGEVPLPDGGTGEISSRFDALVDQATGLMRSAERQVVTAIAADRRETLERWNLAAL